MALCDCCLIGPNAPPASLCNTASDDAICTTSSAAVCQSTLDDVRSMSFCPECGGTPNCDESLGTVADGEFCSSDLAGDGGAAGTACHVGGTGCPGTTCECSYVDDGAGGGSYLWSCS